MTLTTKDITAGYRNPAWQGWGYLGERRRAETEGGDKTSIRAADKVALELANGQGMTADQFFGWLNSRNGRFYGDLALWGESYATIKARAIGWNLVCIIGD